MFEIDPPETKSEIEAAVETLSREVDHYLQTLSDATFEAPQGRHWSPSGHIRHLAKSVRAVAKGMNQPKLVLRAFGRAKSSRSFDEVLAVYRGALTEGDQAGKFGLSQDRPSREEVMSRWRDAQRLLEDAMQGWSESALDRYRLPHPLIGKLTVREMLFFTLFHNAHHVRRIQERAAG